MAKKISAADAAGLVKSGMWLDYGAGLCQPDVFDKALGLRVTELANVKFRSCLTTRPRAVLEADPDGQHIFSFSWHFSGYDRKKHDGGRCTYVPLNLGEVPDYYRRFIDPVDIAILKVCPRDANGFYNFSNARKPITSVGFETNARFSYHIAKLFIGYTFTSAKAAYLAGNQFLPLLPKNKVNLALIYEKERNFKLGLEGYFTDQQYLYNGMQTPAFWEFGFMAEKTLWKNYSFFINFENFTDTRQSRYKTVVNGSHSNPTFDDIWTHT